MNPDLPPFIMNQDTIPNITKKNCAELFLNKRREFDAHMDSPSPPHLQYNELAISTLQNIKSYYNRIQNLVERLVLLDDDGALTTVLETKQIIKEMEEYMVYFRNVNNIMAAFKARRFDDTYVIFVARNSYPLIQGKYENENQYEDSGLLKYLIASTWDINKIAKASAEVSGLRARVAMQNSTFVLPTRVPTDEGVRAAAARAAAAAARAAELDDAAAEAARAVAERRTYGVVPARLIQEWRIAHAAAEEASQFLTPIVQSAAASFMSAVGYGAAYARDGMGSLVERTMDYANNYNELPPADAPGQAPQDLYAADRPAQQIPGQTPRAAPRQVPMQAQPNTIPEYKTALTRLGVTLPPRRMVKWEYEQLWAREMARRAAMAGGGGYTKKRNTKKRNRKTNRKTKRY